MKVSDVTFFENEEKNSIVQNANDDDSDVLKCVGATEKAFSFVQ